MPLLDQPVHELRELRDVVRVHLVGAVAVVVRPVIRHDPDANGRGLSRRGGRPPRRNRQRKSQVRVDQIVGDAQAGGAHRIFRHLVTERAVVCQSGRQGEDPASHPPPFGIGTDADQGDLGPDQTAGRGQQQQRVGEAPPTQGQASFQHTHARHDHHVVAPDPGRGPEGVDDLPDTFQRDSARAARGAVLAAVPVHAGRRQAVASLDRLRTGTQEVDLRVRVHLVQESQERLQRTVVAEVPGAEQAEEPDPRTATCCECVAAHASCPP